MKIGRVQVVCLSQKEYCSPASLLSVQGQPAHLGTSENLLGSSDPLSCSLELFFASVQPLAILPTKTAPFSAATSSSWVLLEHSGVFSPQRTGWLEGTQNHHNIWPQQKGPLNPLKSASQSPFRNRRTVHLVKKEFMSDVKQQSTCWCCKPQGKFSLSTAGA